MGLWELQIAFLSMIPFNPLQMQQVNWKLKEWEESSMRTIKPSVWPEAHSFKFRGLVSPPVILGCWVRWSLRFLLILNLYKSFSMSKNVYWRVQTLISWYREPLQGKDYFSVTCICLESNLLDALRLNLIRIFCWKKLKEFTNVLIYANDFSIQFGAQDWCSWIFSLCITEYG